MKLVKISEKTYVNVERIRYVIQSDDKRSARIYIDANEWIDVDLPIEKIVELLETK